TGMEHASAIQPIFRVIGGELIFLNMELFRGLNFWYLGALAEAERVQEAIVAAGSTLGMVASLRRFSLAWLRADRGAADAARAVAAQLRDHGELHHNSLDEGRGRWVLAEVLRRMGDLDGADREIQAALGMTIPLEHPGALGTLSALRLAQGRS